MSEPLTPEEEAALRERLASGHALGLFQMSIGIRDLVARLLATLDAARAATPAAPLQALVNKQAKDEGLWFIARTAPEAYLQQELRRLHTAIEEGAATPAAPEARPSSQINSAEDAQALASGATEQRETDDHRRLSAEDARVLRREKE